MILRILDNSIAETRRSISLNANATMPDILLHFPHLSMQKLSNRSVMNQEIVCYDYRNDHEGVIARRSRQELHELKSRLSSFHAFEDHLAFTFQGSFLLR